MKIRASRYSERYLTCCKCRRWATVKLSVTDSAGAPVMKGRGFTVTCDQHAKAVAQTLRTRHNTEN